MNDDKRWGLLLPIPDGDGQFLWGPNTREKVERWVTILRPDLRAQAQIVPVRPALIMGNGDPADTPYAEMMDVGSVMEDFLQRVED